MFRGSIVAGPAYAPRTTGPLVLPQSEDDIGKAAGMFLGGRHPDEPHAYAADTDAVEDLGRPQVLGRNRWDVRGPADPASTSNRCAKPSAKVDLWDRNGPSGRYYWTVVPVKVVVRAATVEYRETELAAGRLPGRGGDWPPSRQ